MSRASEDVSAASPLEGDEVEAVEVPLGEENGGATMEMDADDATGPSFFEEEEACRALLARVAAELPTERDVLLPSVGVDPSGPAALLEVQLPKLLDRYQESPHLLHPHLEGLIDPLIRLLLDRLPSASEVWAMEEALQAANNDAAAASSSAAGGGISAASPTTSAASPTATSSPVVSVANTLGQNFDLFDADAAKTPLHVVCRALYFIIKCAGEKSCTSYFPNDVRHCEDVFYALRYWKADPHHQREWEVRYCLLLWLSNLVLVPFALSVIDSNAATVVGGLTLSDALLETAVRFLNDSTKCREGAALLVARLLTRSDSAAHRRVFFSYVMELLRLCAVPQEQPVPTLAHVPAEAHLLAALHVLASEQHHSVGYQQFLLPGVLLAIAKTLKLGQRRELLAFATSGIVSSVAELYGQHPNNTLLSKTAIKVEQRLLLTMLKKTSASWKYRRHVASLSENLHGTTSSSSPAPQANTNKHEDEDDGEVIEGAAEELEEGIGLLLEATGHKDSVVRWSAAKGVGRVCERLPLSLVQDVVGAIWSFFSSMYNEHQWHGGLLTLAELCRRSILSTEQLNTLVPIIIKGLAFDLSKGTYSVGANVRDAACYACWSLARAYDAEDLSQHVNALSVGLVLASLFDREVHVRRAASAALQECVGRLGNFPDGIALVTGMDFFALASRTHAYTEVAPLIAAYPAYTMAMLVELVGVKLLHWDRQVRCCAAVALGRIASRKMPEVMAEILPELLRRVVDNTVATRHGAILGLAELVRGLPPSCWTNEQRQQLVEVLIRLDAARLYRSRGGEYVRQACCSLLRAMAEQRLELPEYVSITKISGEKGRARTLAKIQEFLEESWRSILEWLQLDAAETFRAVAVAYYSDYQAGFHGKVMAKMMAAVESSTTSPLEKRGFLAAMGGIPASWLLAVPTPTTTTAGADAASAPTPTQEGATAPYFVRLTEILAAASVVDASISAEQAELADAESRRNAVRSLSRLVCTLPTQVPAATSTWFQQVVVGTMMAALQDYATDKRGDVGSFVRLAVLRELPSVVAYGLGTTPRLLTRDDARWIMRSIVKALMEKLDRVRGAAGEALVKLAEHDVVQKLFSAEKKEGEEEAVGAELRHLVDLIRRLAPNMANWGSPQAVLPAVAPDLLHHCPLVLAPATMEGLVLSAGDVSAHVRQPATAALMQALDVGEKKTIARLSAELVAVGERFAHQDRVIVPLSRIADFAINQGVLDVHQHSRVVEMLRSELRHFATTIVVLLPLTTLLSNLCRSTDEEARRKAWSLALTMVASRYPKVRAKMATEFYTALLVLTSSAPTSNNNNNNTTGEVKKKQDEDMHAAMSHLLATQWDGTDAAGIRAARNQLYSMLGLNPPQKGAAGEAAGLEMRTEAKSGGAGRTVVASTYSHLVQEAGY